jgi:hypothetical protein
MGSTRISCGLLIFFFMPALRTHFPGVVDFALIVRHGSAVPTGLGGWGAREPNDKSLGYFRVSLTGL